MIVEVDGVRFDVPDDATPEEIGKIAAPPREKISRGAAFARGAVQGATVNLSDEARGGVAALASSAQTPFTRTPGPQELASLYPGVPYAEAAQQWFAANRPDVAAAQAAEAGRGAAPAAYAKARDVEREGNRLAREDRPGYYLGGEIAGAAVPALALGPGASGGSTGAKMLAGAKSAAPIGAAYGFGGSESSTPGGQMLDAFIGGTGGAAVGAAIPAAMSLARPVLKRASDWLSEAAINQGRKVLTGNAAPMATRKPLSEEAIRAAYDVGAIRPFGTVEKAAEKLSGAREAAGQQYADLIAALEAKGVTGPNAAKLAGDLLAQSEAAAGQTLTTADPGPAALRDVAYELLGLKQGMHGLKRVAPKPLLGASPGGDLGLTQAENMKRTLQQAAQAEYVKEGAQSLAGEAKTDLASHFRRAIEDEVAAQASKAPAEAAAFEPVKRQVGALIEASKAADRGAARAANRQTFGLGSKVLAGGALASGNVPGAAATLVGATALRNRGPATAGAAANAAAKLLRKVPERSGPATATPEIEALLSYLREHLGVRAVPAMADEDQTK